jgi:hypothetical protein
VVAAADVVCGTDVNPYSTPCQLIASVTGTNPGGSTLVPEPVPRIVNKGGAAEPGIAVLLDGTWDLGGADRFAAPGAFVSTSTRDAYWPRAALAWLVASLGLVLAAVQLVSPTRRWRVFRRRPRPEDQP